MTLKASDKLTQPEVNWYIEWLGRAGYRNVYCNMAYDARSYELMNELFALLSAIKPLSENGARSLWICAKRGSINDFAKHNGTCEELIDEEVVQDQAGYEEYWREMYPNELEWYELIAIEDKAIEYQAIMLQHRQVLEQDGRADRAVFTHDVSAFVEWMIDSVRCCIKMLKTGSYNEIVEQELPAKHRTGTILRKDLWTIFPDVRDEYFKDLTQSEIDAFLNQAISDPAQLPKKLKAFTANTFFRCCSLGYAANNYEGTELDPRDQYYKHADRRHGGLLDIDPNSPVAFSNWYQSKDYLGAHPWEVCRGGNSTHIDLYVVKADDGYYLRVAGTSTWRSVEAIKFFLAIHDAGVPVVIHEAELLKNRLRGLEKVGVVPFGVTPAYCQSWFPNEHIEVFMNLDSDDPEKMAEHCTWQTLTNVELVDKEG